MVCRLTAALAVVHILLWPCEVIISKSDDAWRLRAGGRPLLLCGSLIALFVLFSIWGILQILNVAFFGGVTYGSGNTNAPVDSSFQGWEGAPY